jgi:hypothetical protein
MLITNGSRQCVIKLKEFSDKRANSSSRNRRRLTEANNNSSTNDPNRDSSNLNIDISSSQLTENNEDRSLLGRLLSCKPCRQVTDTHKKKVVCPFQLLLNIKRMIVLFFQEDAKRNWEDSEANLYWKYKAVEFYAKTQEADKVQEKLDNLSNG